MSGHTPGPWRTSPCSSGGLYVLRGKLGDPQYSIQIYPEQDAHLVAAAPDLLAVAEQIVEREKAAGSMAVDDDMLLEMARAAIAKAKGE